MPAFVGGLCYSDMTSLLKAKHGANELTLSGLESTRPSEGTQEGMLNAKKPRKVDKGYFPAVYWSLSAETSPVSCTSYFNFLLELTSLQRESLEKDLDYAREHFSGGPKWRSATCLASGSSGSCSILECSKLTSVAELSDVFKRLSRGDFKGTGSGPLAAALVFAPNARMRSIYSCLW